MKKRHIGPQREEISAIGLGCMGMSEFYGKSDDGQSIKLIVKALNEGVTMLDTADCYGNGHNERLVGKALKVYKGDAFVATKFGIVREEGKYEREINNSPVYIRQSVEKSLKNISRDTIDLYYIHRLDKRVPIEESVGELSLLVKEGKIRHIGLSEVSAETLHKAEKVHHITALQSEYSLFTRHIETKIMQTLQQNGTSLVAYSPLGRGILSGIYSTDSFNKEGDFRNMLPRFSKENFEHNQKLIEQLNRFARSKAITPAQAALAWLLHKDINIIPIPGTRREQYLMQNIESTEIVFENQEITLLDKLFYPGAVKGERYTKEGMAGIEE